MCLTFLKRILNLKKMSICSFIFIMTFPEMLWCRTSIYLFVYISFSGQMFLLQIQTEMCENYVDLTL